MRKKNILIAVLLVCIVVIGIVLAAYFLNKKPETPQGGTTLPNASQTPQSDAGQMGTAPNEKENQLEQFAKYIDFEQNGQGEIKENGEYINSKYKFVLHVPEVWKGNYRADVLDMTNEDAVVAYISLMYTYRDNEELLGKIVIADKKTWETWEKSQMMTMPEVITRSADKSIVYGITVVDTNPLDEGSEAYNKFEAMRIKDVQTAKELFALTAE